MKKKFKYSAPVRAFMAEKQREARARRKLKLADANRRQADRASQAETTFDASNNLEALL